MEYFGDCADYVESGSGNMPEIHPEARRAALGRVREIFYIAEMMVLNVPPGEHIDPTKTMVNAVIGYNILCHNGSFEDRT